MIYRLNEPALFLVCLLMAASIMAMGTLAILPFRRGEARHRPSLLPPPFMTAIVFPAAIVMGLLVNDSWKRFIDAQDTVQQESALLQLFHVYHKRLAEPFRTPMGAAIERYEQVQIPEDWRLFRLGKRPAADDGLGPILDQIDIWTDDAHGVPEAQQTNLERMRNGVMELRELRAKRNLLSEGRMDWPKWLVVFFLLFTCTLTMSEITLHMRSAYLTAALLFVLGNGSVLYLLATHERPFAGGASVQPPMVHALLAPAGGGTAAPVPAPATR